MKSVYFVSLNVWCINDSLPMLFTNIIDSAENETDALGQAIVNLRINPNRILLDYNVQEYQTASLQQINDLERTIEITQQTFLNLLDISALTITQNVHHCLIETNAGVEDRMPNKIPAIKLLREHLKPYIGLKGCKEIVEQWIAEIQNHRSKTGLINIVRERLGE